MRAVVFERPGSICVKQVPTSSLPEGGLTVRTSFAGVCGSDVRTWRHGSPRIPGRQILGHEASGVVQESNVPEYPEGTKVAICPGVPCLHCSACQAGRQNMCISRRALGYDFPGAMAELFAVPADAVDAGCVVALPEHFALQHAALAEPLHTVLNGQDQVDIRPAESVLVLGLGPIGTFHVAVAQSRGAMPVLGLDPLVARVAAAAAATQQASVAVLDDRIVEDLRAHGGQDGWDVVVMATSSPKAIALAMSMVARCGRILLFAGLPADIAEQPLDLNAIHYRQLSITGAFGGTPAYFRNAVAWLVNTRIDLDRFVTNVHPLVDAEAAFARVAAGDGLKTMLVGA